MTPDTKDEARAAMKGLRPATASKITTDATSTADKAKTILRNMTALRAQEHEKLFECVHELYSAFGSPIIHSPRLNPDLIIAAMRGTSC